MIYEQCSNVHHVRLLPTWWNTTESIVQLSQLIRCINFSTIHRYPTRPVQPRAWAMTPGAKFSYTVFRYCLLARPAREIYMFEMFCPLPSIHFGFIQSLVGSRPKHAIKHQHGKWSEMRPWTTRTGVDFQHPKNLRNKKIKRRKESKILSPQQALNRDQLNLHDKRRFWWSMIISTSTWREVPVNLVESDWA